MRASLIALVMTASTFPPAVARADLLSAIPADAWAAYTAGRPSPTGGDAAAPAWALVGSLVDRAHDLGLLSQLDGCSRQWVDALGAISDLGQQPHALVLLGARATARANGGAELAELHAAAILEIGDGDQLIRRRIQHLVSTYTNDQSTNLACVEAEHGQHCKLRDRRMPEWFMLEWGPIGDRYVVSIGSGAFQSIEAVVRGSATSLARAMATGDAEYRGPEEGWMIYADLATLRRRAEGAIGAKLEGVLRPLGLADADCAVWSVTHRGRAVEVLLDTTRGGKVMRRTLGDGRLANDVVRMALPDEATAYTVLHLNQAKLLRGICDAYLASRSPEAADRLRQFWSEAEAESRVSVFNDVLPRLAPTVMIHDYPPHALDLPFARTVLVRVDSEPDQLRASLDAVLRVLADRIVALGWARLVRHDDGVWCLSIGLEGPALTVTRDWLVISFSPSAVRSVVARLNAPPHTALSQPD